MRFRSGIGRLDANRLNSLVRTDHAVSHMPAVQAPMVQRAYGPVLCKITDSYRATLGIQKFHYEVQEVMIGDGDQTAVILDVPNGMTFNRVWNLAEIANDADYSSGIDRDELPGTFELRPIPTGAVVAVWFGSTSSGNIWAWFDRAGEFDGDCEALTGGDGDGGGSLLPGTVFIQNGLVSTSTGGVEAAVNADASTTVLNSWVFDSFMYRDRRKNGTWADDGLGLLMTCSTNSANFSDWVSTFPAASGTFVITEAGNLTEIFRLNYTGSSQFTTNVQRYGSPTGVDYEGTVPTNGQRVDVYYS